MAALISELGESNIFCLTIEVNLPLSKQLIDRINSACDSVDGFDGDAVLLLHLKGSTRLHNQLENSMPIDMRTVSQWERALRRLERLNAITISTIDGYCGGAGFAALLVTDYRIATENAHLSLRIGEDGVLPDMTLYRIVNQIGAGWARRLGLFGFELPVANALEIGLIDELRSDAEHAAGAFARSIDESIRTNLPMRRRLLLEESLASYENAIGVYLAASDRHLRAKGIKHTEQGFDNSP